jgi:hypothetical protein
MRIFVIVFFLTAPGMRQVLPEQGHFAGLKIPYLIADKTQAITPDGVVKLEFRVIMPDPAEILAFQMVRGIRLLQGSIDFIKMRLQIDLN